MKNSSLLIDGKKVATERHAEVRNPANGEVVGGMPLATRADLDAAVAAAARAFLLWSKTSSADRAQACRKIADKIEAAGEHLAHLLTLEQGKPLGGLGSRFEIGGAVAWTRHVVDDPAGRTDQRGLAAGRR
jgi:acyl-CoA reductase-like NAD-dependent aldehyde dehydrogenase